MNLISMLVRLHNGVFSAVEMALSNAILGLLARGVFAATLLGFFWNSALTKVLSRGGPSGPLDYLTVEDNVFAQIAPVAFEQAGYDASALGVEYALMAYAGTFAEFVLPLLIVVGLFTRLASFGMLGFIAVMTWVDVTGHGKPFDLAVYLDGIPAHITPRLPDLARAADHALFDERLMWLFPLVYLVIRGAGAISLDFIFGRFFSR